MRSRVWKQASGAHDAIDVPACLTGSCPRRLRKKEKKKIDKVRFFFYLHCPPLDGRECSRLERSPSRALPSRALPSRALPRRRRAP